MLNETPVSLDLAWVRSRLPALAQNGDGNRAVLLDGPGGTQVPQRVIDAVAEYLQRSNANTGGAYDTSFRTHSRILSARGAMADFLACDPAEVVFGPNLTPLTFAISRAISRDLKVGEEIVLTHLDHDNNVNEIVRLAQALGAMAYVDAVHCAPLAPIDVCSLDCDFLVGSTYKFIGPLRDVRYGKRAPLERLCLYKLNAASSAVPNRWEWGTLNLESIAGIVACVEYFADLGLRIEPLAFGQRAAILSAWKAIQKHGRVLMEQLIASLLQIPGPNLCAIRDPKRFDSRCPTVALRIRGHTPIELATKLGQRDFFTWDGNYYALNLSVHLEEERKGGFLRVGLAHYQTAEEVVSLRPSRGFGLIPTERGIPL
jgi:selenocysteine lyase/cysteine desulfurase